jgi:5'-3' exonuclease
LSNRRILSLHLTLVLLGLNNSCTHPNDDDLAAALSEKDVMLGIFNYIDKDFDIIAKKYKI